DCSIILRAHARKVNREYCPITIAIDAGSPRCHRSPANPATDGVLSPRLGVIAGRPLAAGGACGRRGGGRGCPRGTAGEAVGTAKATLAPCASGRTGAHGYGLRPVYRRP